MDIILLEKIDNVGGVGDTVSVKSGYARNYLIPQGKATLATPANIAKFEGMRSALEAKAMGELEQAENYAWLIRSARDLGIIFNFLCSSEILFASFSLSNE